MLRWHGILWLLRSDCRGAAALEFAVMAAAVMAMTPLVFDLATVISSSMSLSGSMRSGVQYALSHPADNTGVANVIQTASGFAANSVTVSINQSCQCFGVTATCGQTCTGGGAAGVFDNITASYHVPTMLPYAGYPNSYFPISKAVIVRVQ